MVCKFCHKPLPAEKGYRCPNCFAAWTPDAEEDVPVKAEKEEGEK